MTKQQLTRDIVYPFIIASSIVIIELFRRHPSTQDIALEWLLVFIVLTVLGIAIDLAVNALRRKQNAGSPQQK